MSVSETCVRRGLLLVYLLFPVFQLIRRLESILVKVFKMLFKNLKRVLLLSIIHALLLLL